MNLIVDEVILVGIDIADVAVAALMAGGRDAAAIIEALVVAAAAVVTAVDAVRVPLAAERPAKLCQHGRLE